MKKIILPILAILLCSVTLIAQPKVETSRPFDEPNDGWNKLLQLKNGNTFFFHFNKKEGIEVIVYDSARKQIADKTLESEVWDAENLSKSTIVGLYEINGQPVIFLNQVYKRTPSLFRICLDARTARITSEKEIATLPKISFMSGYAMAFGGVPMPDFHVEKDPTSDFYAVEALNSFSHESDKRIEVIHYDGTHHEINRAFYNSPENNYKYIKYLGMAVDGERLFMCTYAYNTTASGGKDARVIVSKLSKGSKDFKQVQLEFEEKFNSTEALFVYNKSTDRIQLLTLALERRKTHFFSSTTTNYYAAFFTSIKPEDVSVEFSKPIVEQKVNDYFHNQLGKSKDYEGNIQNMLINKDNTVTLLTEEITVIATTHTSGHSSVTTYTTRLGNIGMTVYDTKGDEVNGYAILKAQSAKGILREFHMANKQKGFWASTHNINSFLSYDYINSDKSKYIVFNDLPTNTEGDEDDKHKTVNYISKTNTICYKLENGTLNKFYLFGTPKDDDQSKFCYIEASNFLKETNTYATILMERDGRDKQAKIAWVTFE